MRAESVALNYAEALFALGEASGRSVEYADLLDALAEAIRVSPRAEAVLMSPKVPKAKKADLLAQTLAGRATSEFVLFLKAVVKRGRQGLLPEMAHALLGLLDVKFNRTRASVTLARQPDEALRAAILAALTRATGKEVIATYHVDPSILGGAIVRVGDRVLDGSVRRRAVRLRRQLLAR